MSGGRETRGSGARDSRGSAAGDARQERPLRIVVLLFSPNMGGAESVVRFQCRELARTPHEITLVTTDEIAAEYRSIPGLRVVSIGRFTGGYKKAPRRWHRLRRFRVLRALKRGDCDVIHAHLLQALEFVRQHRHAIRAPVAFSVHGAMGLDAHADPLWSRAEVLGLLSCVTHFNSAARFLLDLVADAGVEAAARGAVIPNGVDRQALSAVPRFELDGAFSAFYSGGDRYLKGPDLLAGALPEIAAAIPGFRLRVLREIPPGDAFRRSVSEHGLDAVVDYVGFADYARFCALMKASDCVILPSRSEGIAASLVEAMALGRPVVATAVGGTPEIVKHERNGLLVRPDAREIAQAVIRLYREPELRRAIGRTAQADTRALDWASIAGQYVRLYQSLAQPNLP
ncbi:MAG TPA: glycosyltransferase family 4 protein, partial [Myxococcota bacterium]